ncbi:hypothetical protein MKUB_43870 [Mycobacterium kubicae]|uniref:DUF4391 domain-containing protein n=1 Tax=Mycobacterium kubicae TaxID=120959 RepID=A0AAX1J919_9MYCO|nr:hypothetical protein [Mycobacterium kubicae]QPI37042.1 hypothetical protein I2456_21890 [Mycobacterium kubicae]GFG66897.1 hypothetical protein MKUB_43870 [Mycobacterium kubicae]
MEGIQLFGRGSLMDFSNLLSTALDATARNVAERLRNWNADSLLDTPAETVIAQLVEEGSVRCPRLLTDQAWQQPDAREVDKQIIEFGEPVTRRVKRLVLVVPFEGEMDVFTLRADTSSTNPPRVLRLDPQELHLAVDDPPSDGAAVRAMFEEQIANIERYLGWSRQQIDAHNKRIRDQVPRMVEVRREEMRATRRLQADTGYPTSRPTGSDT